MIKIAKGLGIAAVGVGVVMAAPALGKGIKSLYVAALKKAVEKAAPKFSDEDLGWDNNQMYRLWGQNGYYGYFWKDSEKYSRLVTKLNNLLPKAKGAAKVSAGATRI